MKIAEGNEHLPNIQQRTKAPWASPPRKETALLSEQASNNLADTAYSKGNFNLKNPMSSKQATMIQNTGNVVINDFLSRSLEKLGNQKPVVPSESALPKVQTSSASQEVAGVMNKRLRQRKVS